MTHPMHDAYDLLTPDPADRDAPPEQAPPPADVGRESRRAALKDLVSLASHAADTEAAVEREREAARAAEEKRAKGVTAELSERHRAQAEQVKQLHADRVAAADEKLAAVARDLDEVLVNLRRQINHEVESVEKSVKQQYEQAAWLAESVHDAAQFQVRQKFGQTSTAIENELNRLTDLEHGAARRMGLYKLDVPELDADAAAAVKSKEITDPDAEAAAAAADADRYLASLGRLFVPRLLIGTRPVLLGLALCIAAAVAAQASQGTERLAVVPVSVALVAALAVSFAGAYALRVVAASQAKAVYLPLLASLTLARRANARRQENAALERERDAGAASDKYRRELHAARETFAPVLRQANDRRNTQLQDARADHLAKRGAAEAARDATVREADQWQKSALVELRHGHEKGTAESHQRHAQALAEIERRYAERRAALEGEWAAKTAAHRAALAEEGTAEGQPDADWNHASWRSWHPPRAFVTAIRFGELRVDIRQIAERVPQTLPVPAPFSLPALLKFPRHASLMIHHDLASRPQAIATLQMTMARLLTSLPAGRVRFTLIDPVGLGQSFAGFMHLADHDEALVGGRIWTEAEQVDQRLADLTEHMETVIQKYLRNEYETIDDYNAQAGELAEPYRFLVIADLPTNFSADSLRRLASIASTGARCGVYTLIGRDVRQPIPSGGRLDELEAHSINLVTTPDGVRWRDDVLGQFPLQLDSPPGEERLTEILETVGRTAREAKRVEVPFETILPRDGQTWGESAADDLHVPIGRAGATRLQTLRLGKGVAQHALIAGKTGSGKSTLLNGIITNVAAWYAPDEVELYLIDFKKGVEFKAYAAHELPHARAIAVESDREFGLSVLQRLDAELARRGELFRKAGVQDLPSYRRAVKKWAVDSGQWAVSNSDTGRSSSTDHRPLPTAHSLPRILLIIDEFQEFFSEDDRVSQDASLLLDRLVRQGRAFGVHVLLGSQTIGGSSGLARSTIGQMAVRIALQTSEADSQLILGDNNSAARLLSRPGEAIYNDAGGLVEANSPFQVAWLSDEKRDEVLSAVRARADGAGRREPAAVFEGNATADVAKNAKLATVLASPGVPHPQSPKAWLGDPVAIKEPTAVTLRRQSGANVLVIGQQEETAAAMTAAAMVSLSAQHAAGTATFYLLDGTPAGSAVSGVLPRVAAALRHPVKAIEYRSAGDAMGELADELRRRLEDERPDYPAIFVVVYGLQRYRALRKSEESFSFSTEGGDEKKVAPDKLFTEVLRDGPAVGMHVIAWIDTAVSIDRTLDRTAMREFDYRVLMQMSASDSSNLIDSPAANKLGYYRAIAFSEEQGVTEKFRPYGLPTEGWLAEVGAKLRGGMGE